MPITPNKPDFTRNLITARNANNQAGVMSILKSDPVLAAQLSKLTTARDPATHDNSGQRQLTAPRATDFQSISADISQKDSDAETLMQLFPEIKLASEIMISCIISPNDMYTEDLNYSLTDGLQIQPLSANLIQLVRSYFSEKYNLLNIIPKLLRESLFGSGAYAVAVVPENSVDDLINGDLALSRENLSNHMDAAGVFKPVGYLGPAVIDKESEKSFSVENFLNAERYEKPKLTPKQVSFMGEINGAKKQITLEYLSVTDNANALKMPKIVERQRKEQEITLRRKSFGREVLTPEALNDRQLTSLFYRASRPKDSPLVKVKTGNEISRYSVGAPLVMVLPTEAVIPVHPPGNPDKAVGYFVLLDAEGHPLSSKNHKDHFDGMRAFNNSAKNTGNGDMSSYLIGQAGKAFGTGGTGSVSFQEVSRIYGEIVEADLLARLRNGIYGDEVVVGNNQEVYRLMLARTFAKRQTQVLFVPAEMLTYFAYRYNENGTGKSFLEDSRILSSMRAQMLFARVMAAIKNSIGRTKVRLSLSPEDPDPTATIHMAMSEVMRARQLNAMAGVINPSDVLNQINQQALEFEFDGHPGLPETKIEFSESSTSFPLPDNELEEDLRKRVIMGFGLSPEMIDDAAKPEFATTALRNNLLLAKRVRQMQDTFMPLVTSHARQVLLADNDFMISVKEAIQANIKQIVEVKNADEELVELYKKNPQLAVHMLAMELFSNFDVNLASPNVESIETMKDAMDVHGQIYDTVLDYFMSSDAIDAGLIGQEASERLAGMKGAVKAALMRRWIQNNGMLPEVFELVTVNDDGKPFFDVKQDVANHTASIAKTILGILEETTPVAKATDAEITKLKPEEPGDGGMGGGSDDSSSGGAGSDDFGMGDMGGMGDMDLGDTPGSSDAPGDDTTDPDVTPEPTDAPTEAGDPFADDDR